jgi:hypothetical protein
MSRGSISSFFESLGAPLKNIRWSWGAVRRDGTVVLRVWNDFIQVIDGEECALVDYKPKPGRKELGYRERLEHVNLLRSGRPCLMVLCTAEDDSHHVPDTGVVRRIVAFEAQTVLVGGGLVRQSDGRVWMRIADRRPAASVTN